MAARRGSHLLKLLEAASCRRTSSLGGERAFSAVAASSSGTIDVGSDRIKSSLVPHSRTDDSSTFSPRGQARGFRIRDLFDSEKAAERKRALRSELSSGHFDDLKGAKTANKPFEARVVPEKTGLTLPSLDDLDVVVASSSPPSSCSLGRALAGALEEGRTRGPIFLLVGSRASAEPHLDSWAAAWKNVVERVPSSPSFPPSSRYPVVDLTLFDRVSPILLALPGGKRTLLRGAERGARARGASVAAAHFGGGGSALLDSIGASNPLSGYCCLLDFEISEDSSYRAGVRWIGAGEAMEAEERGLGEALEASLSSLGVSEG